MNIYRSRTEPTRARFQHPYPFDLTTSPKRDPAIIAYSFRSTKSAFPPRASTSGTSSNDRNTHQIDESPSLQPSIMPPPIIVPPPIVAPAFPFWLFAPGAPLAPPPTTPIPTAYKPTTAVLHVTPIPQPNETKCDLLARTLDYIATTWPPPEDAFTAYMDASDPFVAGCVGSVSIFSFLRPLGKKLTGGTQVHPQHDHPRNRVPRPSSVLRIVGPFDLTPHARLRRRVPAPRVPPPRILAHQRSSRKFAHNVERTSSPSPSPPQPTKLTAQGHPRHLPTLPPHNHKHHQHFPTPSTHTPPPRPLSLFLLFLLFHPPPSLPHLPTPGNHLRPSRNARPPLPGPPRPMGRLPRRRPRAPDGALGHGCGRRA